MINFAKGNLIPAAKDCNFRKKTYPKEKLE